MPLEIWTEKYRPKKLDELVGQEDIVERLKSFVTTGSIPNLLFAGPAGNGKTTAALCIARQLYGKRWRANKLELNASDARGIDVIRGQVKDFARTKPLAANFKLCILDEADALTPEAQQALRRTMETYSGSCRFCLICNYSSRIIPPIQSRCAVFRFKRLNPEKAIKYLESIAKKEGLELKNGGLEAILALSEGDLRRAINLLQSVAALGKPVAESDVYQAVARARPKKVRKILQLAVGGKIKKARQLLLQLLLDQAIAAEDLVKEIHRQIYKLDLSEEKKLFIIAELGEHEFRINQGSTPQIQLEAFLAKIAAKLG